MPVSIRLNDISWSTPQGSTLFSHLDITFLSERTGLIGRNGVGKTTLLKLMAGELRPASGNVSVTGTLGVLRQAVQSHGGAISDLFGVREEIARLRRVEQGVAADEDLELADWTLEARAASALGRLKLDIELETPLLALSGGQRTRAGLAALLFAEPDFILLDEPTNNLDRGGREAVLDMIGKWRRGAVVVSHDRDLLENMDAIVELTSLGAARYGGNWSAYRAQKELELSAVQHDLRNAEKRVAEVEHSARAMAQRKDRRDATGKRKAAQGGEPRINLGRLKDRSEGTSGANARLAERRRSEAAEAATSARERIEILQPFTVTLPSSGLPAGKTVLTIDELTAGYAPDAPILRDLSFTIVGPERVALTGPNGSGKTTLLAAIAGQLAPRLGSVRVATAFAMLDQRVSILDPTLSIRDNFRRLQPASDENSCRAVLARFMFRADAALQIVGTLSGGQILRAGLACVLGGSAPPPFLILDEPTNHLDIDSIETVEAGLRAYDGALLVVSHDESFLRAIGITRRLELPAHD